VSHSTPEDTTLDSRRRVAEPIAEPRQALPPDTCDDETIIAWYEAPTLPPTGGLES
jgi:hypothetical protein